MGVINMNAEIFRKLSLYLNYKIFHSLSLYLLQGHRYISHSLQILIPENSYIVYSHNYQVYLISSTPQSSPGHEHPTIFKGCEAYSFMLLPPLLSKDDMRIHIGVRIINSR